MNYTEAIDKMEEALSEILQNEGVIINQADMNKLRRLQAHIEPMLNGMEAFGNVDNENLGKLDFSKLKIQTNA